ncbi:MAG TPA: protease pro-enzyme activation domain-containing protein [Bryobacteraceae bacterium]
MPKRSTCSLLAGILVVMTLAAPNLHASQSRSLITEKIDEAKLVTLAGATRREANARNDRGAVAASFQLHHMQLVLRRPPETEQALDKFIEEQNDPNSPNFHHWLNAREFGEKFGLASGDIQTIKEWLQSHGFTVHGVYNNGVLIDFTGTVAQVREAFHTEIHNLEVKGTKHIANMSDPQIPAALAPAIIGIASLNNFFPHALVKPRPNYTSGSNHYLAPPDLATIYNLNPLFSAGISGRGHIVAVVEDTDLAGSNCTGSTTGPCSPANLAQGNGPWNEFRKMFGLARAYPYGTMAQIQPQPTSSGPSGPDGYVNCYDPGINSNDTEAVLDVEWVSAAAPNAAVWMITCADTEIDFGAFIGVQNLINTAGPYPDTISVSYGESEPEDTASYNAYTSQLYQQCVTEGISVFSSSGDEGGDSSDGDLAVANEGLTVSALTSTAYNVSVGGTDFEDTYNAKFGGPPVSTYWSATNSNNLGSALSYVPEIPWNDSCGSLLYDLYEGYSTGYGTAGYCNNGGSKGVVAGSGGFSNCFTGAPDPNYPGIYSGTCQGLPKPSWQSGILGNPSDGVRDVPDVSLFASQGQWGHAFIYCTSRCPATLSLAGGTSFASPIMSGIQALVNQKTGERWGNPNPYYYSIANSQYTNTLFGGSLSACNSSTSGGPDNRCVFHDVTQGDIALACPNGTQNCYNTGGAYGVLSTGIGSAVSLVALETLPFPGGTIVSSPGSGYTSAPTCKLSGGGGTGATCTATASTAVGSLSLTASGSGYTATPTCAISGGGGSGATCTARRSSSTNTVTSVTLTAGGTNYTSNPTCTITGTGTGAACSALADGVGTITLTNGGSGYTAPPDCTLTGGGGSGATCGSFLDASSFESAYAAGTGWDFATGLGTVNAYNLVMSPSWTAPKSRK